MPEGAIETCRNYDSSWTCMMQTSYKPPTNLLLFVLNIQFCFEHDSYAHSLFSCSTNQQHGSEIHGRLWLANTHCQIHPLRISRWIHDHQTHPNSYDIIITSCRSHQTHHTPLKSTIFPDPIPVPLPIKSPTKMSSSDLLWKSTASQWINQNEGRESTLKKQRQPSTSYMSAIILPARWGSIH